MICLSDCALHSVSSVFKLKTRYEMPESMVLRRVLFFFQAEDGIRDRKITRLNSSAFGISYAVFCLKKKNIHRHSSRLAQCQAVAHKTGALSHHSYILALLALFTSCIWCCADGAVLKEYL